MGDGICLFRSLSLLIDGNINYRILREEAVKYICTNWEHFHSFIPNSTMQEYQTYMGRDGTYGGNVELVAISELYNVAINNLIYWITA